MCYESEGLVRKLRAYEQLQRDRQKAEAARRAAKEPPAPAQPSPAVTPSKPHVPEPNVTV